MSLKGTLSVTTLSAFYTQMMTMMMMMMMMMKTRVSMTAA